MVHTTPAAACKTGCSCWHSQLLAKQRLLVAAALEQLRRVGRHELDSNRRRPPHRLHCVAAEVRLGSGMTQRTLNTLP